MLDNLSKLKEFKVEIVQGSTRYRKERKFATEGIPFISAKTIVRIGDIVFVRVGVECIGRVECFLIFSSQLPTL